MFPANLDHLRVEWMKRVRTRQPGLRQGTTVSVHTNMDMEEQSDHKLITPSGMGLFVCGAGSHPPYGGEPEPVRWSRIIYSLA